MPTVYAYPRRELHGCTATACAHAHQATAAVQRPGGAGPRPVEGIVPHGLVGGPRRGALARPAVDEPRPLDEGRAVDASSLSAERTRFELAFVARCNRLARRRASTCTSSCAPWSTRARPICTSPPALRRSCASTARWCRSRSPPLTPDRDQAALLLGAHRGAEGRVREEERARSLVRREEPGALSRQHLHAARRRGRRVPRHSRSRS